MFIRHHVIYPLLIVCCVGLSSCSQPALHDAQRTVQIADSLWSVGEMYEDSTSLALAYEDYKAQSSNYPTEYLHACYHYGRLLRAKDNPVDAMRCFINASHTDVSDWHFLGRVYSNMGDMAHLADEFNISYELFAKSAEMFMRNGDTTAYYYALIDMAFELAEQGKEEETLALLNEIIKQCSDASIIAKNWETRAELYLKCKQYDSTIYYARIALDFPYSNLISHMQLAQAYSYMGERDSATQHANIVLTSTDELYFLNNALYIITNDDDTQSATSIRETASNRADAQKLIEVKRAKLAQATQLVELDQQIEPDNKRLYPIIVIFVSSLILISLLCVGWLHKRKMQNKLNTLSQQYTNDVLTSIKKHIDKADLNNTLHWKDYKSMKSDADLYMGGIVSKLEARKLNEVEIRFCILTILDFPLKKIADIQKRISTSFNLRASNLLTIPPMYKSASDFMDL